jgi:hypothetical protein
MMKFYSAIQIKRDEGAERGDVWEGGETIQELVWKPEVYRAPGRIWFKSKGKYKIDLQVIVWE